MRTKEKRIKDCKARLLEVGLPPELVDSITEDFGDEVFDAALERSVIQANSFSEISRHEANDKTYFDEFNSIYYGNAESPKKTGKDFLEYLLINDSQIQKSKLFTSAGMNGFKSDDEKLAECKNIEILARIMLYRGAAGLKMNTRGKTQKVLGEYFHAGNVDGFAAAGVDSDYRVKQIIEFDTESQNEPELVAERMAKSGEKKWIIYKSTDRAVGDISGLTARFIYAAKTRGIFIADIIIDGRGCRYALGPTAFTDDLKFILVTER